MRQERKGKRDKEKKITQSSEDTSAYGKKTAQEDLQADTLPHWQRALRWGLREVQPGSTPPAHTTASPSPVLPELTGPFPGDPSLGQAGTQQFPYRQRCHGAAVPRPVWGGENIPQCRRKRGSSCGFLSSLLLPSCGSAHSSGWCTHCGRGPP